MNTLTGFVLFSIAFFGISIPLMALFYTKVGRIILMLLTIPLISIAMMWLTAYH